MNSYPEVVESQKIQDILPNGMKVNGDISSIKVNGTETAEITKENITIDGVEREKLIWTAKNIGYGEDAKYIDIPVIINEEVFKNIQREDLGSETTVLDVQFSQDGKSDKYLSGKDTTGKKVNLFLRTAGKTNKNNGYIYAGQSTISTKPSKSVYADSTYNTMLNTTKESTVDEKVTSDLNNSSKLVSVLDNFTEANENGTMSKYISGGLPSKASINKVLGDIYNNTVKISDTQVILWYKVSINNDQKLQRYYKISGTSFGKYVDIPTCSYHLDGVIVDIRSLGTRIPTGAQVNVTNTAQLIGITGNNSTSSAKISIYYKSMSSARRFSIASYTYVPKESINEEKEVNTELPKINTEIKKVETEKKNTTEEKKNVEAKNTTENKNIIEEKNVTENKNTVEEIKTTENKDAAKEKKSNTTKNTNKLEDNVISEQKSNNVIEKTDSKNVVISD